MKTLHRICTAALSAFLTVGCSAQPTEGTGDPNGPTAPPAQERAESLSPGLQLTLKEPDRVAGTFTRERAALRFDFARVGTTRTLELHAGDGHHIVTSTVAAENETVVVHAGALVVSGPINAREPQVTGDLDELERAAGEAALLPELRTELEHAGVDPTLVAPTREMPEVYFNTGDGLWHLQPGESKTFPTWGLWYPTNVYIRNVNGANWDYVQFQGASGDYHILSPWGDGQFVGHWWGYPLTVYNPDGWVGWGWVVTGPNEIGVTTW